MSVESRSHVGAQFKQLPMFMSAREIKSQYDPWHGDFEDDFETPRELWDRKYEESMDFGHHMTIPKEGVRNPVSLEVTHPWWTGDMKPQIMGGHHRIEVMARHKPDTLMPVEHLDDFWEAKRSQARYEDAEIAREAARRRGYR